MAKKTKKISHVSSMIVLAFVFGLGTTVPCRGQDAVAEFLERLQKQVDETMAVAGEAVVQLIYNDRTAAAASLATAAGLADGLTDTTSSLSKDAQNILGFRWFIKVKSNVARLQVGIKKAQALVGDPKKKINIALAATLKVVEMGGRIRDMMPDDHGGDDGDFVTGKIPNIGEQNVVPGTTEQYILQGYHSGSGTVAGDENLVAGNIRSGATIFGVAGKTEVVDTAGATATAGDILAGKTAYADGALRTGTIETRTLSADNETVAEGFYAATSLSVVDSDLVAANIKKGVTLFGVAGKPEVVDTVGATATPGDMLAGKTAYVAGELHMGTIETRTLSADNATVAEGFYAATSLSAVDSDLVAAYIKKGVTLFGVTGTYEGETIALDLGGGVTMALVRIPAGTFTMGSPDTEDGRFSSEGPQHQVTISKDFYMGVYEVTQAQYQAIIGSNPSHFTGDLNRPVELVSWDDCQIFCQQMSTKTGRTVRLPTEAEWEYACRAGTTTRFHTGDAESDLANAGWYASNSGNTTHPVGQKTPNAFGLYDMHGNVWEWCQDWYGSYSSDAVTDPTGPAFGTDRVMHGGSWYDGALGRFCRSANRGIHLPDFSFYGVGFRVVVAGP